MSSLPMAVPIIELSPMVSKEAGRLTKMPEAET